ncbi:GerMN domain-containing protein [Brevibacillus dissolubilis]|uniref:GerMN domain-containing protein n=1 Tax=Brevibacillus dissolubilis TaxID=1844116 RepID=UPI001115B6E1|nr:GerMN domain-containing protein [Brevibacillus dissolubilis]
MKRFAIPVVLSLAFLTACGTAPADQTTGGEAKTGYQEPTQTPAPAEAKVSKNVKLYYTDANLMEIKEEEQTVELESDKPGDIKTYEKAIELLGKPSQSGNEPLWKDFQYNQVTFDNGTLTIDAKSGQTFNLGASGEEMAIEALKKTLFQFSEVQQIVIQVDGKPVDSLMGHVDTSKPFTR